MLMIFSFQNKRKGAEDAEHRKEIPLRTSALSATLRFSSITQILPHPPTAGCARNRNPVSTLTMIDLLHFDHIFNAKARMTLSIARDPSANLRALRDLLFLITTGTMVLTVI